jgi:hypothetical protein
MGPNPVLADLKNQLQQAKEELDIALTVTKMTEKHPHVQVLRARVAQLEGRIKEEPETAVVRTVNLPSEGDLRLAEMQAQAEWDMANREIARLESRLKSYESLWAGFGPIRQEYLEFIQQRGDLAKEAAMWQQKLMEVEAALQAQISESGTRLAAVQNPQKQFRPSSPTMGKVMAFAILGGLAFGAGLVFLASVMDRAIAATEDAAGHFDIPVFGVIGEIVTQRELVIQRLKKAIVIPVVTLVALAALGLSSFSIYLRLEEPASYRDARKAVPAKYLLDRSGQPGQVAQPAKGT